MHNIVAIIQEIPARKSGSILYLFFQHIFILKMDISWHFRDAELDVDSDENKFEFL